MLQRNLWSWACAIAFALPGAASAQTGFTVDLGAGVAKRGYLGLNLERSPRTELSCGVPGFACEMPSLAPQLYGGWRLDRGMAVEVGYMDLGRLDRQLGTPRAQGLNLSLVGRTAVSDSIGLYGRLGTTYSRTESAAFGESGFGLSYGAGVSWSFSEHGTATLGWESHDFRFAGPGRDNVRATRLGLQWRY